MSISANFPNVFPSLELNFAQSQQLDPRVTFSRSTTAPYYDGKTSVLAEQNLVLYSQDFTNAAWAGLTSGVTVVGNNATAPDGTTTADTATFTGSSYRYQFINTGVVTGVTYTFSVWISSLTGKDTIGIRLAGASTGSDNNFSLVSLTTTPTRISVTRTFTSSDTQIIIGLDNRTAVVGGGQTTGDVIVWGAQLEQRSSVTAYNATTSSPITNYIPQLLTAPINQPRFDFNPTTGESLGLLIEQSSTNLLTYSEQFDNATWSKIAGGSAVVPIVTANQSIAPDGTLTADLVAFNCVGSTTADRSILQQAVTVTNAVSHTISFWIQAADAVSIGKQLRVFSDGLTGSSTIITIPSTRTRFSITGTSNTTSINVSYETRGGYTTNTSANVFLWGAQLEAGAFATSYIPTTSAQVTRASDNASMTGTNFSSWYNTAEGTFYSDVASTNGTNSRAFSTDDGSTSNQIVIGYDTSRVRINNVDVGNFYVGIVITGKRTISYAINQQAASNNGAVVSSTNNGTMPVLTNFRIGSSIALTGILNGAIKKIAYYPTRLTNAQLQALTT